MKNIITLLLTLQLGLLAELAQSDSLPIELINYQGTLSSNGVAVNEAQDLIFRLYNADSGGTPISATITNSSVGVTDGKFDTLLDGWSANDLSDTNLHLEIALRRSGSGAPFVTLSPRQRILHLPKAAVAEKAMSVPASALDVSNLGSNAVNAAILAPGSVQADKIAPAQVVKSFNGLQDDVTLVAGDGISLSGSSNNSLTISTAAGACDEFCYWRIVGNFLPLPAIPAQTFNPAGFNWLGTKDTKPLELRVNTWRGLRLEPTSSGHAPNFIGGFYGNVVNPGTVGATIGGGGAQNLIHRVSANYGTIGGGLFNLVSGYTSTVGAGAYNTNEAPSSVISGGDYNWITKYAGLSTVAGGRFNVVIPNGTLGGGSVIGGGQLNRTANDAATVGGGFQNFASGNSSIIAGGGYNSASAANATIGGGGANGANGQGSTVGGGLFNNANGDGSTVGGGGTNLANAASATVSGGKNNTNTALAGTISGGHTNSIQVNSAAAAIGGGERNLVQANSSFATIGGGRANAVAAPNATVGGGYQNVASGNSATTGGGYLNSATANFSTISGGRSNVAIANYATIGGGTTNLAVTPYATIPGGQRARTASYGQQAYASGQFANAGDAQSSLYVSRNQSANNNATELFLDGIGERMSVPLNGTWTFQMLVTARDNFCNSGGWRIEGVVENCNGVMTLLCWPVTTLCEDIASWDVRVAVDQTTKSLTIFGIPGAGPTNPIRWVATTRTSEVVFP